MEYKWAQWETTDCCFYYKNKIDCMHDGCKDKAFHIAIAEEVSAFDPEDIILKARCKEHFNKKTQKTWLRKWRNKNIK